MRKPDIYMTIDEYISFVNKAHEAFFKERYKNDKSPIHHPSDLAVTTADFFEATYAVVDSLTDIYRTRKPEKEEETPTQ
jgi:hypothetical protein